MGRRKVLLRRLLLSLSLLSLLSLLLLLSLLPLLLLLLLLAKNIKLVGANVALEGALERINLGFLQRRRSLAAG